MASLREPARAGGSALAAVGRAMAAPRLYGWSQDALVGATGFDLGMTAEGLNHKPILRLTIANPGLTRTVDLNFAGNFAEGGWARAVSAHNAGEVCATYASADALLLLVSRRLARRGGGWRAMATVSLLAETAAHVQGGRSWVGLPGRLAAPYGQFQPIWVR